MKRLTTIRCVLTFSLAQVLAVGCSTTPSVNPPHPSTNTGYVDFHTDPAGPLSWQIDRFDERTRDFKNVFLEYEPSPRAILRLAFAPGHYRLSVMFLNRVIADPAEVQVEIFDGKITPVRVELVPAGTTTVVTKGVSRGATAYGQYGRRGLRTTTDRNETVSYAISLSAEQPVAYQPTEQMAYGH